MLQKVVQEAREPKVPRALKEPQVSPKGLQEVVDHKEHKELKELLVM